MALTLREVRDLPWNLVQFDKLPGPNVLEDFEKQGWDIFQIIHYKASDKVYVYLRRNIVIAKGNGGPFTRQQRRNIERDAKKRG